MKIFVSVGVLLIVKCITGLDPALDGDPRQTFPARRAIDGSRGRKYYVAEEEDAYDIYGFGGQYDPYRDTTDFSDIRINVPGEPGVNYPSYVTIPQTSFQCQKEFRGYYADEEAGCQLFHVCDGNFLVSSFLCPIGSIFSQKLLTCDWWNKVDCSSTRNYYIVNSDSLLSEVDDDEILRKAYEMTSLQTAQKGVSIDSRARNSILESARFINDLQTNPNRYRDYADDSDMQYKYSSRYNSGNYRDREIYPILAEKNQRNPKIKVHTIGQDHNDAEDQSQDFKPSYAPTVPTVTTTTRRFYSPTVPTTSARSMSRPGHDLDFESSDHLYSARGKTPETSTTPSPVTKPTIDTTTSVVVEVPPILTDAYQSTIDNTASPLVVRDPKDKSIIEQSEITMDMSKVLAQFTAIEFQSLYSGDNYTFQIDVDDPKPPAKQNKSSVEIPSTHIIPPFFYYSNIDQHNAASTDKIKEESKPTSTNKFIINVPATDIIPPHFHDFYNETRKNYVDNQLVLPAEEIKSPFSSEMINILSIIKNTPKSKENRSLIDNSISSPSKVFLPPFDDFHLENSTDVILNDATDLLDQNNDANREESHDSMEGESSPFQVTLLVKGDEKFNSRSELIKSLIAQHDSPGDIRDIEIEQSQRKAERPLPELVNTTIGDSSVAGDASKAQIINYAVLNKLQGIHPLGSLKSLQRADHLPRPFSIDTHGLIATGAASETPTSVEKIISQNCSHEHEQQFNEKKEILQPIAQTFVRKEFKTDVPLKFELPHVTRTIDFRSDRKLNNSEEQISKDDSSVDTEVIPSIGFSLNTAEERKEYEAVIRRLLTDLSIPSLNTSTYNS